MAISINQQPNTYTAGFNPMPYVISSNQSAQPQFRFYTKIKDLAGNVLSEFRNLPQPGFSSMIFDPHRTIETYLSYDIENLIGKFYGVNGGVNVFKGYTLEIQEEYADASGVISGHSSGATNTRYAVNASINYLNFVLQNLQDKLPSFTGATFLSNQPKRVKVRIGDSYEVGTIAELNNQVKYFKVETYDRSGALLKTATIENANPLIADPSYRFLSILCGPDDLNNTTLTTGTQTLIEDNTHYYRIAPFTSTNVQFIEWQEFEVDRSCTRDGYNRVFFLNPYGRFDAFNFTAIPDDTIEVERSNYDRVVGGYLNDAGTQFGYGSHQRERSQFFTNVKQSYKLVSEYLDTDTAIWLKDLVTSPLAYMIVDGKFVAININNSNYSPKSILQSKTFQLMLDISLSVDAQRQRL